MHVEDAISRVDQPTIGRTTVQMLLDDYAEYLDSCGHRPRGVARYLSQLRNFAEFVGFTPVEKISRKRIVAYQAALAKQGATGKSLRVSLSVVRSFFNWLTVIELIEENPTDHLPWPRAEKTLPRGLSADERRRLTATIDAVPDDLTVLQQWRWQRNRNAVYTFLYTGVRISEATALRWSDVDLDARTIMIRGGKGGKDRVLVLHDALYSILKDVPHEPDHGVIPAAPDGRPFGSYKALAHIFERWLRTLGFRITAHQLRHTFAQELLRSSRDIMVVKEALGHESLDTTAVYLAVDMDRQRAAINTLGHDW
jgi:site-specific recombinase XerD